MTIGITAYNAALTIERAVASALSQTWRPIEILAVDDFSCDQTLEILERIAKQHDEIRGYGNRVNSGVAVARNRILEEAKGDFVAFFDDDDVSAPDRVAVQLARILDYEREFANGAPVICHAARRLVYPDGSEGVALTMGESEGRAAPAGIPVATRILVGASLEDGYGACPTCSQMARLSTYRSLGGFDPAFRRSEDTEFNVRLARAGGHFIGVGRPLVTQYMTKTSDKSLADEYGYTVMMLEKHRDIIESYSDYDFTRRWIDLKQAWLEKRWRSFVGGLTTLVLLRPAMTWRRLALAAPNIGINRAFRRFHGAPRT